MNKYIRWFFAVLMVAVAFPHNAVAQFESDDGDRILEHYFVENSVFRWQHDKRVAEHFGTSTALERSKESAEAFVRVLELTEEQSHLFAGIFDDTRRELLTGGDLFGNERQQIIDTAWKSIDIVLKQEQQKKFYEIIFQMANGRRSISDPNTLNLLPLGIRVLAALDLTEEQKGQVRKLVADRASELHNVPFCRDTANPVETYAASLNEIMRKYAEQVVTILTTEQKVRVEKLITEAPASMEELGIAQRFWGGDKVGFVWLRSSD